MLTDKPVMFVDMKSVSTRDDLDRLIKNLLDIQDAYDIRIVHSVDVKQEGKEIRNESK